MAQDEDDDPDGGRRWPGMTAALVLFVPLVLLVGGGGYGFWRYNQSQYYVGVDQDGYVAIFRGTDQVLAASACPALCSPRPEGRRAARRRPGGAQPDDRAGQRE